MKVNTWNYMNLNMSLILIRKVPEILQPKDILVFVGPLRYEVIMTVKLVSENVASIMGKIKGKLNTPFSTVDVVYS